MVVRFKYKDKGDGNMNLKEILKKHEMWLKYEKGGERANLEGANLEGANLEGANLYGSTLYDANLRNVNLCGANLYGSNLCGANLYGSNLESTNLEGANLESTNLEYANLYGANLYGTNLCGADLRNANLCGTNLCGADLRNANLRNAKTNMNTIGYNLACPEKGSFIGYKKANSCIIELLILEDAKRSSATTMKCRCDKAKVLDIRDIGTGDKINVVKSDYDPNFIYEVGEVVSVNDFDDDRWNECSTGIHFFMNRENALKY